jgi:ferredoxin
LQISFRKTLNSAGQLARDSDGDDSIVYKQPENAEEEALCREAIEGCPVEAIGDDRE